MNRKNAVITGAARGLGYAGAERFLKSGQWKVALFDVNEELLATAARQLGEKYGVDNVRYYKVDVTSQQSVETAIKQVIAEMGSVDTLINNAGITRDAMLHKMTPQQWNEVIFVNLASIFNMSRQVIDGMRERGYGRIINISSINGQKGQMGQTNYSAAKAGAIGFTRALAQETANKGITVNAVAPGYIDTEMIQAVPQNVLEKIVAGIPVGRLGTAEEIAACVAFLAREDASFITGACLTVNGGQYMAA